MVDVNMVMCISQDERRSVSHHSTQKRHDVVSEHGRHEECQPGHPFLVGAFDTSI